MYTSSAVLKVTLQRHSSHSGNQILNLILSIHFVLKIASAFKSAVYIQMHFRLLWPMEANTMNPDQTAPLGAVRSGSILFAVYASKVVAVLTSILCFLALLTNIYMRTERVKGSKF